MLRELAPGLADRRLARWATALAAALRWACWAAALAAASVAALLAVALALSALLTALPAHPALLVAGATAGYALAWVLALAACWAVLGLLARHDPL